MNKYIKTTILLVLVLGLVWVLLPKTAVYARINGQPNDYWAITSPIVGIGNNAIGAYDLRAAIVVYYVPLHPEDGYKPIDQPLLVNFNISRPSDIQIRFVEDIKNDGVLKGIRVVKVLLPNYNLIIP